MKIKGKSNKARIRQRQEEASNRREIRETRTPAQQLKLVKTRPGESKKEKHRLVELIKNSERKKK